MTHGGKRSGAGRPKGTTKPVTRRQVTFKLPIWLADWLRERARSHRYSQAKLIEEALVEHFRLNKNAG